MMYQNLALIALSACALSVEGFSVGSAVIRPSFVTTSSSTCLFSETNGGDAPAETTAAGDDAGGSTDILNSAEFLQRKLDVIYSDITKVEEEIIDAKAAVEEGKAEWGAQFDALEAEVSSFEVPSACFYIQFCFLIGICIFWVHSMTLISHLNFVA
jgi:hypothetical protein